MRSKLRTFVATPPLGEASAASSAAADACTCCCCRCLAGGVPALLPSSVGVATDATGVMRGRGSGEPFGSWRREGSPSCCCFCLPLAATGGFGPCCCCCSCCCCCDRACACRSLLPGSSPVLPTTRGDWGVDPSRPSAAEAIPAEKEGEASPPLLKLLLREMAPLMLLGTSSHKEAGSGDEQCLEI